MDIIISFRYPCVVEMQLNCFALNSELNSTLLLLFCHVNQAAVSVKRIEKFLLQEDIDLTNVQTDPNIGKVIEFCFVFFSAALMSK